MNDPSLVASGLTAVAAGLLSFLSPCVLPLVPAYLSYVGGVSLQDLRAPGDGSDDVDPGVSRAVVHNNYAGA